MYKDMKERLPFNYLIVFFSQFSYSPVTSEQLYDLRKINNNNLEYRNIDKGCRRVRVLGLWHWYISPGQARRWSAVELN